MRIIGEFSHVLAYISRCIILNIIDSFHIIQEAPYSIFNVIDII
jgi:hypothetical protein